RGFLRLAMQSAQRWPTPHRATRYHARPPRPTRPAASRAVTAAITIPQPPDASAIQAKLSNVVLAHSRSRNPPTGGRTAPRCAGSLPDGADIGHDRRWAGRPGRCRRGVADPALRRIPRRLGSGTAPRCTGSFQLCAISALPTAEQATPAGAIPTFSIPTDAVSLATSVPAPLDVAGGLRAVTPILSVLPAAGQVALAGGIPASPTPPDAA